MHVMTRAATQLTGALVAFTVGALIAFAATPLPERGDQSVYDTANIIDAASERAIELQNRELLDKTGVAIVILTVPALVDESIDALAVRVGQSWGVGQRGKDRGLVVALSLAERKIFVATGYGTEAYLPDGKIGRLLDEVAMPFLRLDRFAEGLLALDTALADASASEFGVTLSHRASPPQVPNRPGGPLPLVFMALGLLVLAYLAWRHPGLLMFFLVAGRHGRPGGRDGGFGGFGGGGFGGGGGGRGF